MSRAFSTPMDKYITYPGKTFMDFKHEKRDQV